IRHVCALYCFLYAEFHFYWTRDERPENLAYFEKVSERMRYKLLRRFPSDWRQILTYLHRAEKAAREAGFNLPHYPELQKGIPTEPYSLSFEAYSILGECFPCTNILETFVPRSQHLDRQRTSSHMQQVTDST